MIHGSRMPAVLASVVFLAGFAGCSNLTVARCRISSMQSVLLMDAIDRQMRSIRLEILGSGFSHDQIVRMWCSRYEIWKSVLEDIRDRGTPTESRVAARLVDDLEKPLFDGQRMIEVQCNPIPRTVSGHEVAVDSRREVSGHHLEKMAFSAELPVVTALLRGSGIKKFVNQMTHVL